MNPVLNSTSEIRHEILCKSQQLCTEIRFLQHALDTMEVRWFKSQSPDHKGLWSNKMGELKSTLLKLQLELIQINAVYKQYLLPVPMVRANPLAWNRNQVNVYRPLGNTKTVNEISELIRNQVSRNDRRLLRMCFRHDTHSVGYDE